MASDNDAENLVKSLELAAAQIEMSLQDSAEAVSQVLESVLDISVNLGEIDSTLTDASGDLTKEAQSRVLALSSRSVELVNSAVMAMQFYDRLSQRLEHVEHNLCAISKVMQVPGAEHKEMWEVLQTRLKAVYSTEQEQELMALVQEQGDLADAVAEVFDSHTGNSGEAEFF